MAAGLSGPYPSMQPPSHPNAVRNSEHLFKAPNFSAEHCPGRVAVVVRTQTAQANDLRLLREASEAYRKVVAATDIIAGLVNTAIGRHYDNVV